MLINGESIDTLDIGTKSCFVSTGCEIEEFDMDEVGDNDDDDEVLEEVGARMGEVVVEGKKEVSKHEAGEEIGVGIGSIGGVGKEGV